MLYKFPLNSPNHNPVRPMHPLSVHAPAKVCLLTRITLILRLPADSVITPTTFGQ